MSPPKLARDAPVLDVFEPVAIGILVLGRIEDDVIVHYRRECDVCKVLHTNEPLQRQARFDRNIGALGIADFVVVFFHFLQKSFRTQVFDNLLSALEAIHADI